MLPEARLQMLQMVGPWVANIILNSKSAQAGCGRLNFFKERH